MALEPLLRVSDVNEIVDWLPIYREKPEEGVKRNDLERALSALGRAHRGNAMPSAMGGAWYCPARGALDAREYIEISTSLGALRHYEEGNGEMLSYNLAKHYTRAKPRKLKGGHHE